MRGFSGDWRLAALGAIERSRYVLNHYADAELEEIRRSVVRLYIGQAGGKEWSDSELDALQHWSRALRQQ
ncbi:MAG TPA: hypothetical protein VHV55_25565 [Pirellulales bacterium]|nr:hypothetical protein [Pirellulales bacterium]